MKRWIFKITMVMEVMKFATDAIMFDGSIDYVSRETAKKYAKFIHWQKHT